VIIAITGTTSGVGKELWQRLGYKHTIIRINRDTLDLSDISAVSGYITQPVDMLINCAGTDRGGKIEFAKQDPSSIVDILNTNLIAPVLLSQKVLRANPKCKIVNITSTNNKRYWPNNLAYSLSKKALSDFGSMLQVDYPDVSYLEIQLGLTKTNFNQNRYVGYEERVDDVYVNPHLTAEAAVEKILGVLFDPAVKFIEISP
jgi:short-subunit dehydrogenase